MTEEQKRNWHDKHYKKLLLIPLILLILTFVYLGVFYTQHKDFIYKDISLTGGTSITIYNQIDIIKLEKDLQNKLDDIGTRKIYDLVTREQKAIIIETKSNGEFDE